MRGREGQWPATGRSRADRQSRADRARSAGTGAMPHRHAQSCPIQPERAAALAAGTHGACSERAHEGAAVHGPHADPSSKTTKQGRQARAPVVGGRPALHRHRMSCPVGLGARGDRGSKTPPPFIGIGRAFRTNGGAIGDWPKGLRRQSGGKSPRQSGSRPRRTVCLTRAARPRNRGIPAAGS